MTSYFVYNKSLKSTHVIKKIMSFNKYDYEILVDFDFYILLLLLVEVDVNRFVSVTTSSVCKSNY